jgi:hypothetical protein
MSHHLPAWSRMLLAFLLALQVALPTSAASAPPLRHLLSLFRRLPRRPAT